MPSRTFAVTTLVLILATIAWAASTEKVLHGFPIHGNDGKYSTAGLIFDSAGNLYGTTNFGGTSDSGTVFELSPLGNGKWSEKILYSFTGGADGGYPYSSLVFDAKGDLYGTTYDGGDLTNCSGGCGVVFELAPGTGDTWTETVIHKFLGAAGDDGDAPMGPLTFDAHGNLYGTTSDGGVAGANCWNDCGYVFELAQNDGNWSYQLIYSFQGNEDAGNPASQLVFDQQGNLYGSAGFAVLFPEVVFKLTPQSGSWNFTLLHSFTGCQTCDEFAVMSGVTFDAKGNLFGTVPVTGGNGYGFLYELTPNGNNWDLNVIHDFTNGRDGGIPEAAPIFDKAGNMYGTTSGGGIQDYDFCSDYGCGIVWEASPKSGGGWTAKALHDFTGKADGASPADGLLIDSSGGLYGTTYYGYSNTQSNPGYGVVFEVTP